MQVKAQAMKRREAWQMEAPSSFLLRKASHQLQRRGVFPLQQAAILPPSSGSLAS